jgi:nucleolar complex protein 3
MLKNPTPTPLLPAALTGISTFAHMVNIDFFKDLLKVLKNLISMEESAPEDGSLEPVSRQLMCIVTAFELLSGQGSFFT